MMALILSQFLQEFYFKGEYGQGVLSQEMEARHHQVFTYFGTFNRAYFSMCELTLANWPVAIRVLAENSSEWFFWFGMAYKLSIGFAVIAVVQGVFMQETFKVAQMDDVLMVMQKDRAAKLQTLKMKRFLVEADTVDEDGQISRVEWYSILSDPQVRLWLSSMDLDIKDADNLFNLIDKDSSGYISLDELLAGVSGLRGPARSVDLVTLMQEHRQLLAILGQSADTHFKSKW